ncbi:SPASM domain peptide maturase of grasp-with-spasm system [Chryseobacterium sp. 52]|uniref:grasp-with-spasm system SPASM domain peptide maturase n=1 Tax=Chryseobacterium sp. 52 TaxID=2035213 RepID=UPI000C17A058|nr:grasp-with-spasm system SPASM domain peptide maturase [Chryseobacterium sp. 52]PIF46211.1 SPASM domain peptide maturase of grasp-with-spasm system [Chryseobacterium sp. 52]
MNDLLLLYSHCIIVKGISRAVICDLQRKKIHPVPNAFAELFEDGRYFNVPEIISQLDADGQEILSDYLKFIEENELAFYCSAGDLELFPKMPEEWLFPAKISHCILDADNDFFYFDEDFLQQLEPLCCNFIQFRFFKEASWSELKRIMDIISPSQIKSVEIILPYKEEDTFYQNVELLVTKYKKISILTVSGASVSKIYKEGNYGIGYIIQTDTKINSEIHCGVVHSSLFSINIPVYTESLAHNTCLHRKVGIDSKGNIKNCPSMKENFGNIKNSSLKNAVDHPEFQKYWNITKDEIIKCKECEFRHVCTDCRAYIDDPENIFSAPLKCGYNPYTCEWEEWSNNPLKEKAIHQYRMPDLVKSIPSPKAN